jgi:hypothetical protein
MVELALLVMILALLEKSREQKQLPYVLYIIHDQSRRIYEREEL